MTDSFADEEPSVRDPNMGPRCIDSARQILGGYSPGPGIAIESLGSIYTREYLLGFAMEITVLTLVQNFVPQYTALKSVAFSRLHIEVLKQKLNPELGKYLAAANEELEFGWELELCPTKGRIGPGRYHHEEAWDTLLIRG